MKQRLGIIDADGFVFFAAWEFREQLNMIGELAAKRKIDSIIEGALNHSRVDSYVGFFGSITGKNFRHELATVKPYKGNRVSPEWQDFFKPILKKHMEDKWKFIPMEKIEADDAVVIAFHQFKDEYDVVMIAEDKDLKQLGDFKQYNPKNRKFIQHNHIEGRKFFWCQCLHGDNTDNIVGIQGVGPKNKLVEQLVAMENPTELEMFTFVRAAYMNKYGSAGMRMLLENFLLLNMISTPKFDYPDEVNPVIWNDRKKFSPTKLIDL